MLERVPHASSAGEEDKGSLGYTLRALQLPVIVRIKKSGFTMHVTLKSLVCFYELRNIWNTHFMQSLPHRFGRHWVV